MTTTIDDIVALHHARLRTLTRKLIYLMIRNGYKEDGWTTISVSDFSKATALTRRAVDYILKDLLDTGIIERRKSNESHTAPYQYKILDI
jgi:DNA-binding Lrp family transcriptional regulator